MGNRLKIPYVLLPHLKLQNVSKLVWCIIHTKNKVQKIIPQEKRGEDHIKIVIEGFEQHMSADMKWNEFLRNAKDRMLKKNL